MRGDSVRFGGVVVGGMMHECDILLVRHPETEANVSGMLVGRGDSQFTAEGRRQLARVPRKIAAFHPSQIWTSPLDRARRLAQGAAARAKVPLAIDQRLVELDFGEAEGLTFEQIAEAGMAFNYRSRETPVAPGGESRAMIEERAAEFCDEIVAFGGRHAIVTHGGVFRGIPRPPARTGFHGHLGVSHPQRPARASQGRGRSRYA